MRFPICAPPRTAQPRPGALTGAGAGTWSTPIIVQLDGQEQIVCFQPNRVVSYQPSDGEINWFCNLENKKGALAYSSAMISDGICVAQGGYSGGGMAFKLGGTGDISENQLWHKPVNPQSIGTGVIIDGYLYIPDAGPSTIRCIEAATGKEIWQERAGSFWSSIVMADGRAATHQNLMRWMEDGTLRPGSVSNVQYADFMDDPADAVRRMYTDLRLQWDDTVSTRIRDYLAAKPKGSHGKFDYEKATPEQIAHERERFRVYQEYFKVPNEI